MIKNLTLNRTTGNLSSLSHRVARRMHLAFLLPGMLVLLVSACSPAALSTTQPSNATTAPVGIASPNALAATQPQANKSILPDDPRAAVEYALRAETKAMPFKVTTTYDTGGTQMVTTIEIESLTRIMMVTDTHSAIWADGKCYEKTGDAAWQACTDPATGQTAQVAANALTDQTAINEGISMIQMVKLTGNETVNGVNTRVYDYTISGTQMGIQVTGKTTLWVDENTGLPVKALISSTANGMSATSTQVIVYDPTLKVPTP